MLDSSANSRWGRSLISDVNLARCAKIERSIIQDALVTFTARMLSRPDRGRRLEFTSATRSSYSLASSVGIIVAAAARPCFKPLRLEILRPDSDRGPQDFCAFKRLAFTWHSDVGIGNISWLVARRCWNSGHRIHGFWSGLSK